MKKALQLMGLAGGLLAASVVLDGVLGSRLAIEKASAIVGRPATPISVAGAARRTTRRVVRRSYVYAATLPTGCTTIVVEGATIYQCGATYYQPYGNQYEVVYID
jgi:hypothetical protein